MVASIPPISIPTTLPFSILLTTQGCRESAYSGFIHSTIFTELRF